jgi:presenilin-like A22 family membrane protease
MKYSIATTSLIIGLFLLTQLIGLVVNNFYFTTELPMGLQPPQVEKEVSPWLFIGMILMATSIFFVLQKFKFQLFMKAWFFFAFTIGIGITIDAFVRSGWISFVVAAAITLLKFKERDIYTHNLGELLIYGGIVALFVPILNLWAIIIILIAISIYDYIAVNITKHMVNLAKMQQSMGIFSGLIIVNKKEVAILGGGDIAFTMLFATVLLRDFGTIPAILAVCGATVGILVLMYIGKKKKYYPAMPFVTAGSLLGFALSLLI